MNSTTRPSQPTTRKKLFPSSRTPISSRRAPAIAPCRNYRPHDRPFLTNGHDCYVMFSLSLSLVCLFCFGGHYYRLIRHAHSTLALPSLHASWPFGLIILQRSIASICTCIQSHAFLSTVGHVRYLQIFDRRPADRSIRRFCGGGRILPNAEMRHVTSQTPSREVGRAVWQIAGWSFFFFCGGAENLTPWPHGDAANVITLPVDRDNSDRERERERGISGLRFEGCRMDNQRTRFVHSKIETSVWVSLFDE